MFEELVQQLVGLYEKEIEWLYANHTDPPAELWKPAEAVVKQLALVLPAGKTLGVVMHECWCDAGRSIMRKEEAAKQLFSQ